MLLLMVASCYSAYISPVSWGLPSYLGLLFPFFVLGNLISIPCWMLISQWRQVIVIFTALLLSLPGISTYMPLHLLREDSPKTAIKLMSYNVMAFNFQNHTTKKPNPIISYILKEKPDIVCLQEYRAYPPKYEGKYLTEARIHQIMRKEYPYQRIVTHGKESSVRWGLAIFSKYPIKAAREVRYESQYNFSAIFTLDIDGKRVDVANVHLESNRITRKDKEFYGNIGKSKINKELIIDISNNMRNRLGPAYRKRARQVKLIRTELGKSDSPYKIICGDINDTPISYAHHTLSEGMVDAHAASGIGLGTSYNRSIFRFKIDYIFHTPNITSYRATTDHACSSSDHYPVLSWLDFNTTNSAE